MRALDTRVLDRPVARHEQNPGSAWVDCETARAAQLALN